MLEAPAGNDDNERFYQRDPVAIPSSRHWLMICIASALIVLLVWSFHASIDVVIVAEGTVIPAARVPVVRHPDGGMVSEIPIKEGDLVSEGQLLMRLSDTEYNALLRENASSAQALRAQNRRLEAEAGGNPMAVGEEAQQRLRPFIEGEFELYQHRKDHLFSRLLQYDAQLKYAQRKSQAISSNIAAMKNNLELTQQASDLLLSETHVSETHADNLPEITRILLQKQTNEIKRYIAMEEYALAYAQSEQETVRHKRRRALADFRAKAQQALNRNREKLLRLDEARQAIVGRVERTAIHAPVSGIVKKIHAPTPGGAIRPGMEIMEIVPLTDTLLIEARVSPADIASIKPGMPAVVKIGAHGNTVSGALPARIERIGPNTIRDAGGNRFFQVYLRTDKRSPGPEKNAWPIPTGMSATVDIHTGTKTLSQHLLQPIGRVEYSLRER